MIVSVPIRAIAVDIDGTVTNYERHLSWDGARALRRVNTAGLPVIAASGNVAPVTKAFTNFVGLSGPMVAENGGVVYSADARHRKILAERRRPDRAVRALVRQGFPARPLWSDPWRLSEVALELNLDEAAVRQALDGWGLEIVTTRFALHIMEPGLDKMNGLRAALAYLPIRPRIRPAEILAIGDSNNDVGMLRGCGYSGAVGNGTDKAKRAARFVARRSFGAGVREILTHHRLL